NDAFVAELDNSTWTTQNRDIEAVDNFAYDGRYDPISINSIGNLSMSAMNSTGTTYDGATVLLDAEVAFEPNRDHKLYLSIFDQGDHALDSAAFVDNIRFKQVDRPVVECQAGASTKKQLTPVILLPGVSGTQMLNNG